MRKPEKVRFELRTNQNLSRQNLQRAYGSLGVKEPEIVNDVPVIGAIDSRVEVYCAKMHQMVCNAQLGKAKGV